MRKGFLVVTLAVMALSLLVASPAFAAEKFPDKPVKMVITHGAGGSVDISSRGIAPYLQKHLGVTVICENMEGAGGRRAMEFVFNQAKPDGYTFVASAFPSRLIGELIYDSDYRMKEFIHLGSWVGGSYRGIFVRADSPIKNFPDLVAESKKKKLTVASGGGMGSSGQVQIIYLKEKIKLNIEMVPFDSGAEVLTSVLGKHVDFGVGQFESLVNPSKAGQTRILAIHAPKRLKDFPEIPTLQELGYEGVVLVDGVGAWAPPKIPKDRAKVLSDGIAKAVADPDFIAWAKKTSVTLDPLGPEEFLKLTLTDYENFTKILPLLKAK